MEKKEMEQESEWFEAQKIVISLDLLVAAKQQLKFLAQVDRNRSLYDDGPVLQKAIYRYNACWLPLLAKHTESPVCEGPLLVPLDCEWVWHCHRLNPVRYKSDCEELYGRVLDNSGVVSSVNGICRAQSEKIWNQMYPDEAYHFDLKNESNVVPDEKLLAIEKCTKYDLVSAVKRQSPFFYQVDRAHVSNDIFLQEAVARYKGFLHLIKRNRENSLNRFCVPTYDVDLIWHTHQLHPVSYCKDLEAAIGKVLEHDDTDSDRTKGKKLDTGFSGTTKQWEGTFGRRYWKAGAMYRGTAPTPLTSIPFSSNILSKKLDPSDKFQNMIQLPELKIVEVLLEIVGVKNLPEGHKGNLFVRFSKKQPDPFFGGKRKVSILSESGQKQVAAFQCEHEGDIIFELMSHSPFNLPVTKGSKTMGTVILSLQEFLNPLSELSVEKWVELQSNSYNVNSKPICIRIAASFTVPTQAPRVLHMVRSRPLSRISCFFSLPGKVQLAKSWTRVIDGTNNEIISLQLRDLSIKENLKEKTIVKKQVAGVLQSGETCIVAESIGTMWSLLDSQWSLRPKKKSNEGDHLFELMGSKLVQVYQGRKLDFEHKHCEGKKTEQEFMTAVEFSEQDPYGKAVALFDLKLGLVTVKQEWFVLPGILSVFIASDVLKRGHDVFNVNEKDLDVNCEANINGDHEVFIKTGHTNAAEGEQLSMNAAEGNARKSGGCGGGCGSGCRNIVESGGCGGSCGSGCRNIVESGGCGGSCGSGCRNIVESGSCGSGCGGGCKGVLRSSGCGGCGAGCGDMVKSGGCGAGGCGAGCGDMVKSGGCGAGGCGAGCGDIVSSGGCGSGCGGGCGHILKSSGCGGCGSGCGDTIDESIVINSCNDDFLKEPSVYSNEAITA